MRVRKGRTIRGRSTIGRSGSASISQPRRRVSKFCRSKRLNARGEFPIWLRALLALGILIGIFFRFDDLSGKAYWEDEISGTVHALGYTEAQVVAASSEMTRAGELQHYLGLDTQRNTLPPLSATIHSLAVEDPQHPPVYYALSHLWMQAFGARIGAIRALPAIFGTLAIPCVALLAYELFASLEIGLIAAALFAVSPFFVLYAQEAREYSLWTLVMLLDGWVLLRAARSSSALWWVAYAALTAGGLFVDPLTALPVIGWFVYVLVDARARITRSVIGCGVASIAALASFAPWVHVMLLSHGLERGMAGIMSQKLSLVAVISIAARNLRLIFFDFGLFRLGPLSSNAINLALTLAVIIVATCALIALVRASPFRVWGFVIIGLCLPMTLLLLDDLLVRGRFVYQMRYFIPAIVGIVFAVAALVRPRSGRPEAPRATPLRAAVLVVLIAGGALSCALSARATTWWNKDYEQPAAVAEAIDGAHDALLVSDYYAPSALALAYDLDPGVAVHLGLRCTQCGLPDPPVRNLVADAPVSDAIFLMTDVRPVRDVDAGRPFAYIDPHTFPPQAEALSMFRSLGGN